MNQGELFYDDIDAALRAAVEMLGGAKRVGTMLWPAKDAVSAQQQMLNVMDPSKPHKISLPEFMLIAKKAREQGVHILAKFMADELDYELRLITPEEKQANVVEQFNRVKAELAGIMKAMERLS